jgi:hypothetical protein
MPQAPIFVSDTSAAPRASRTPPRVRDLLRPVDADEAAGLPVPARVEGQHCVAGENAG